MPPIEQNSNIECHGKNDILASDNSKAKNKHDFPLPAFIIDEDSDDCTLLTSTLYFSKAENFQDGLSK